MLAGGVGLRATWSCVTVTEMSMVTSSITQPGVYVSAFSAQDGRKWHKSYAHLRNLDKTTRELKAEIRAMQEKLPKPELGNQV